MLLHPIVQRVSLGNADVGNVSQDGKKLLVVLNEPFLVAGVVEFQAVGHGTIHILDCGRKLFSRGSEVIQDGLVF